MNIFIANWRCPRSPRSGGAEYATLRIVEGLIGMGHQVTWFSSWSAGLQTDEVRNGVRYLRRGNEVTCRFYCAVWIRKNYKAFDICIEEINTIPFYLHWFTSLPSVTYIHQLAGAVWLFEAPPIVGRVGMLLERWLLWPLRFRPFVAGSVSTMNESRAFGHRGPGTVIGYGVDAPVSRFDRVSYRPRDRCRLVMVSRVTPSKRIGHGIDAVAWLVRAGVDAELDIIGAGSAWEVERLKALAAERGCSNRVRIHGWLGAEAKSEILSRAFVIVSTSVKEGWQLTISEAHVLGIPSVVYPVTGLVDSTIHGKTGLVVSAENARILADGVKYLWENPPEYRLLSTNARQVANKMKWKVIIEEWEQFLKAFCVEVSDLSWK